MKKRILNILIFSVAGWCVSTGQDLLLKDCFLEHKKRETRTIVEDHHGFIWLMRSDGFYRFDGVDMHFIDPSSDSEMPGFHSAGTVLPQRNGDYWFAGRDAGFIIYKAGEDRFLRKAFFEINDTTVQVYGRAIAETKPDGDLKFVSGDNGIWKVDTNLNIHQYLEPETAYGAPNIGNRKTNEVRVLVYDQKRDFLWIGGIGGLFSYHIQSQKLELHSLSYNFIDISGIDRKSFLVNDIQLDGDRLKVASWGGGLMFYDIPTRRWSAFGFENEKTPYRRRGNTQLAETRNGRIFLAHELREMATWQPGDDFLHSVKVDGKISRRGMGAMVDRLGYLWVGHWTDVCRYIVPDEPPIAKSSSIYIYGISIDDDQVKQRMSRWDDQSLLILEAFQRVSFDFRVINPLTYDGIQYEFILEGFDSEWGNNGGSETVDYPSLKNGNYRFQVRYFDAISQAYIYSGKVDLKVDKPTWIEIYFAKGLLALLVISLLGFLTYRYRTIQKQKRDKEQFENQLREVQDAALRSQMNPHFLFNSLNAIRYFIVTNDNKKAANYLTKFSRLIRKILENSKKKLVSLEEELQLLELYINMEKIRFENKFDYAVQVAPDIDPAKVMIPPMLMQPYIENAILHGINPKDGQGSISLDFTRNDPYLIISITDDGIGREKSKELKEQSVLKKESLGLNITKARLDLADTPTHKARIDIIDLYDDSGATTGTRIVIKLPVS